MSGMMHRRRPILWAGALLPAKHRSIEWVVLIERGSQPAAWATRELGSGSKLLIMSWIRSSCHVSSLGPMFVYYTIRASYRMVVCVSHSVELVVDIAHLDMSIRCVENRVQGEVVFQWTNEPSSFAQ